jgi:hypothetical protein
MRLLKAFDQELSLTNDRNHFRLKSSFEIPDDPVESSSRNMLGLLSYYIPRVVGLDLMNTVFGRSCLLQSVRPEPSNTRTTLLLRIA